MKEFAKFVLFVLGFVALVAGILRATKVDEIVVGDDRMAPTILAGERVFLWRGAIIDRGDVVVCANPTRPTCASIRSVEARSLRSASSARPPVCAATASRFARLRPTTVTVAPARASARAHAWPIPRPPPVTSACFPFSCTSGAYHVYLRR